VSAALPRIAVTMGDPSGIGPEICLKALAREEVRSVASWLLVGDLGVLASICEACDLDLELEAATAPAQLGGKRVAVLDLESGFESVEPGVASAAGGEVAWQTIDAAVRVCLAGSADVLVTAPINKVALQLAGRGRHGHTELLQAMTGSQPAVTVFLLDRLRAIYFSRHLSLRQAIDAIRAEAIADMLVRFAEVAPQLGLTAPRIGVAALNPHAGEGGLFGREEIEEIEPGIALARARGIDVEGPVPADSIFHLAAQGRFDAVLGLYHDQVAAVMKSMDFNRVVSVTLGLPFLRFSVDHGTAYDIAGRGIADARNMETVLVEAARTAMASRDTGSVEE
jgi:4-hydroxythreonine-4-phosphate dehydrogenase